MPFSLRRPRTTALCLCLVSALSVPVEASTLEGSNDSFLLGDYAAMMGGAVTAIPGIPEASWYNPAGLAAIRTNSVSLNATAFMWRQREVPEVFVNELASGEQESVDLSDGQLLESSAIVAVWQLSDGLTLTLSFFMPRADKLTTSGLLSLETTDEFGETNAFNDYMADTFLWEQMQFGPAVGWQPTEWLALGLALNLAYETQSWSGNLLWHARYGDDPETQFVDSGSLQGYQTLDTLGLQPSAGVQFSILPELHLGLAFRMPVLRFASWETAYGVSSLMSAAANDTIESEFSNTDDAQSDSVIAWLSPMRLHLGLSYMIEGLWLSAEADLSLPVDTDPDGRHPEMVWNLRAGALIGLSDTLRLGVGLFTDHSMNSAVNALHDARVDYYGGTLGVQYDAVYPLAPPAEGEEGPESLVISTTMSLRYAAGIGEYGAERQDPDEIAYELLIREVLFHEVSFHLGTRISF